MEAVLRHDGRWLRFRHPERVLRTERLEEVLPLLHEAEASGLFIAGFLSYEAAPAFDSALRVQADKSGFPLLCLGLFQEPERIDCLDGESETPEAYSLGEAQPSISRAGFLEAIGNIKERIAEGATYQVNHTYRLTAPFSGSAWSFFRDLVRGQRAEHAAFVDEGDFAVCSASPELFFRVSGETIEARPMKGTAPRGRTLSEDRKRAEALRTSEKNRAENLMIVDMVRNDLGRICVAGSVDTPRLFEIEKYPTLWQMTSTVRGRLERRSLAEVFRALFPCASITGAPKAKTMEIILGLEDSPRRIYTGTVGFHAPNGDGSWNVAIRTALVDRRAGRLEYGVGGGIVWDSGADAELEETRTKARILLEPRPDFRLLETLLFEPGCGIFLREEHLERLAGSAEYFDIPLDRPAVFQALETACRQDAGGPLRIRLLVDRAGGIEVQAFPVETGGEKVVALALAGQPVDPADRFLFHKTTHRATYEAARAARPDADDVVLWNSRGEVTESTIANIVVRKGGRLVTPPVACGLLPGTFRGHLLASGGVEEEAIGLDDLRGAEEIFLVNSVRRWRRARLLPGEQVPIALVRPGNLL